MLTKEIKNYIDESVLCWLATSSTDNFPNVSPKEVFTYYEDEFIIVANIASPQTANNIKENNRVCVSFVDIFIQKGFQIKGEAELIAKSNIEFDQLAEPLLKITEGKYPFSSIFKIHVQQVKSIVGPKYWLYPETTEADQIKSALETYKVSTKM